MAEQLDDWMEELVKINHDDEDKMTDKQIRIIKAAIEVFSEKGFAGSSTNEIAQKAGVAEGTIFRHYKTKKDLLISITAPFMTKFIAPFILRDMNKVFDAPYARYEEFLRAVLVNRQAFVQNNLPLIRILLQEIPFHPELKEQFKKHVAVKVLDKLNKIVLHFQKAGQIAALPPLSVIRMSISVIIGFLLARYLLVPEADWDDEEEIEMSIQFIMNGLSPR